MPQVSTLIASASVHVRGKRGSVGEGKGWGSRERVTTQNLGKALLLRRVPSEPPSPSSSKSIAVLAHYHGHWLVIGHRLHLEVHRLARQWHHQGSVLEGLPMHGVCMRDLVTSMRVHAARPSTGDAD